MCSPTVDWKVDSWEAASVSISPTVHASGTLRRTAGAEFARLRKSAAALIRSPICSGFVQRHWGHAGCFRVTVHDGICWH